MSGIGAPGADMSALETFLKQDRFAAYVNAELLEVAPGYARARMTVLPHHANAVGIVQGGAIFTLADYAFAAASNSHGTVAVAINASITFMKALTSGTLIAEAREVSKNFKLGTYTVEVRDEAGDVVALFQGMVYRKKDPIPA
jgi:acyl-CoA thioesterase